MPADVAGPEASARASRLAIASGERLYAVEAGAGPLLVQVGCGTLALDNYTHLRPHLSRRLRVVDFDLPGFGRSPAPPRALTFDHLVHATAGVIRALSGGPVSLSGISMGGVVAAMTAARFPELVDRLVIGGCLFRGDAAAALMRRSWKVAAQSSGMGAVAELTIAAGFSRDYLDSKAGARSAAWMREVFARRTTGEYLATSDLSGPAGIEAELSSIRASTLVIGTSLDQITPIGTAPSGVGLRDAFRLIEGAALAVLLGCGHCYYIEMASEAAQLMTAFLLVEPWPDIPVLELHRKSGSRPEAHEQSGR